MKLMERSHKNYTDLKLPSTVAAKIVEKFSLAK